jgi:hypothetical protein
MKKKYQVEKFRLASIYFILLQSFILVKLYVTGSISEIFYFCYHAPLLYALAFYRKDIVFVRALIVVGFIGQFVWSADFIYYLISGEFILGISHYMSRYHGLVYFVTLIAHIFSSTLALLLVCDEDISIKSAYYAFIYIAAVYVLSLLDIIPTTLNVNFTLSFRGIGAFPLHSKLYLIYVIFLNILPCYFLQVAIRKVCQHTGGQVNTEISHPLSIYSLFGNKVIGQD